MTISSVFQRSLENLGNLLAGGEHTQTKRLRHTGRFTRREEATYPLSCALPGGQGITDSVLYLSLLVMPLEMSDVDSKSSSGSETNSSANAGEDSLDFMQRMILVQQQHLISQYQCEKSNTSGVNGKCYASYPA